MMGTNIQNLIYASGFNRMRPTPQGMSRSGGDMEVRLVSLVSFPPFGYLSLFLFCMALVALLGFLTLTRSCVISKKSVLS